MRVQQGWPPWLDANIFRPHPIHFFKTFQTNPTAQSVRALVASGPSLDHRALVGAH